MKIFIISDSLDVITGMRLAGVEGVLVQSKQEALTELLEATKNKEYGIVLVTQHIASEIDDKIKEIKMNKSMTVITVIPDRTSGIKENYITDYIKQSIGLKI